NTSTKTKKVSHPLTFFVLIKLTTNTGSSAAQKNPPTPAQSSAVSCPNSPSKYQYGSSPPSLPAKKSDDDKTDTENYPPSQYTKSHSLSFRPVCRQGRDTRNLRWLRLSMPTNHTPPKPTQKQSPQDKPQNHNDSHPSPNKTSP